MLKDGTINIRYQFADLTLNTQLGTLVNQQGEEIKLPWLSYRLLWVLLEASPAIVSQRELIAAVWPDAVVGDETLKQRVKLLRRALQDDAAAPRYIEAIRGRGYRIIANVDATPIAETGQSSRLALATDTHISPSKGSNYPLYWKMTSLGLLTLLMLFVCVALLMSASAPLQKTQQTTAQSATAHSFDNELYQKGLDYYHRYRAEDNLHAIDLFQSVIALSPQKAEAYAGLSDAYSQGVYQFNGPNEWQTLAIDAAYKAIALQPDLALGYKSLGLAYYNKGWLVKAINANLKALDKHSQFAEAMANVSYLYREIGQLKQALSWNSKALQLDSNHSVNLVHRGLIYIALNQYQQAEGVLNKALQLQPDSQLASTSMGQWYISQGLYQQAVSHYQQLLTKPTNQANLAFTYGLAQAHYYLGDYQLAQQLAQSLSASNNPLRQQQGQLLGFFCHVGTQSAAVWQQDATLAAKWQQLISHYLNQQASGSDRGSDSLALAMLYASANDSSQSQRFLIQAINQGVLQRSLIEDHPSFALQVAEPQFQQLLSEIDKHLLAQQ